MTPFRNDCLEDHRVVRRAARDEAAYEVQSGLELAKRRAADALHGVADSLLQSCNKRQDGAKLPRPGRPRRLPLVRADADVPPPVLVVGLTPCAVPVLRALRINPTEALKAEG